MKDSTDTLDAKLFAFLEQIDERLLEICDSRMVIDPDELEAELRASAAFTRASVEALIEDATDTPRVADLNRIADHAGREFLAVSPFPIVLRTTTALDNPALKHCPELLSAMVLRALKLCSEHGGAGGEVLLSTTLDGERAVLQVSCSAITDQKVLPIGLRVMSLADMMQSMGGDLHVDKQDKELLLSLCFGVGARVV